MKNLNMTIKLFIHAAAKMFFGMASMRIKSEEEFLEKELDGYREYLQKVKYRLTPFVW